MKKNKRVFAVIISCILCFTSFIGLLSTSAYDGRSFVNVDPVFLSNQDISNGAYNRMLQAFADEGNCHIEEYYPDYYAGAYIGKDGHLS